MTHTEAVFTTEDVNITIRLSPDYGMIIRDENEKNTINIFIEQEEMESFIKFLKIYSKL